MFTKKHCGAIKKAISLLISIFPSSAVRVFLYRRIMGYSIRNSNVGFGTVIAVKSFDMRKATLGRFNFFLGPMDVKIDEHSLIGTRNKFLCGEWAEITAAWSYRSRILIGKNTHITSGHYFDVSASIVVGDRSWIAGYGSQFWSHGPGTGSKDINIGNDCYIGSAVRFCPGSSIGNRVLVGVGSVLTNGILIDDALIAGVPASVEKYNYAWRLPSQMSHGINKSDCN